MSEMHDSPITVEELVATLERTSLATVLVEGKDDMACYRWLEAKLPPEINIMQAGCRDNVLSIYSQRHRFKVPIAYVADKDIMVFTGIPDKYKDVVFTSGYSIENDVLLDSAVERLFSSEEESILRICVKELTKWYAFEITRCQNGEEMVLDYHPQRLLNKETHEFNPASIAPRIYSRADPSLEQMIRDGYKMLFRGKNLLNLYEYIFQARRRGEAKYSKKALLEIAVKCVETTTKDNMVKNIIRALGIKNN